MNCPTCKSMIEHERFNPDNLKEFLYSLDITWSILFEAQILMLEEDKSKQEEPLIIQLIDGSIDALKHAQSNYEDSCK